MKITLGCKHRRKSVGDDKNGGDNDTESQVHSAAASGFATSDDNADKR